MSAELMLEATDTSLLIIEERQVKGIVIGVPHHAPCGIKTLRCPNEHPDSDENAGFLGRYVAERLKCCSIIACNYTRDVNKCSRSDYAMQIAKWSPKVLIEIHGHKGKENGGHAKCGIEISSGSAENEKHSGKVAMALRTAFADTEGLKDITISGVLSEIHFKASCSVTITDSRWIAYHIELPPKLRKPANGSSGKPPKIGFEFCDALINFVKEEHPL